MEYGFGVQLTLLLMLLGVIAYFKAVEAYRKISGRGMKIELRDRQVVLKPVLDRSTVPGAFPALLIPPSLDVAFRQMRAVAPNDRYHLPLGWYLAPDGPRVAFTTLVRGINHVAISGQSDSGKDNAALVMLLVLALQHPPSAIQFCLIDGKGLDFALFAGKAHVWRLALRSTEIAPTMQALTYERERRADMLRAAGVSKWDEYIGGDLPLLVIYVSELSLLQDAVGSRELEAWLNSELAAGRAFGMRYIVASQTFSNFGTRWRSQIGLYLAGYQPSTSQDQPNTGLTTAEIRAAGGIPPSELPSPSAAAGVFTAVEGRQAVTVRLPYLTTPERRSLLTRLPDCPSSAATGEQALPSVLPTATVCAPSALECSGEVLPNSRYGTPNIPLIHTPMALGDRSSGSPVAVTPEERALILKSRDELVAELTDSGEEPSRRAICRRAFKGATGGAAYRKVQAVMDELAGNMSWLPQRR